MAWRPDRARQPPRQMDSGPRPFARAGVGRGAASGVDARHSPPSPRHSPESHDEFAGYPPGGGEGRRNDFAIREGPRNGRGQGQGRGRGAPPRWPRWTPAASNPIDDDDDSSSSSSDDEPEFRDMHIVIDHNRIENAEGADIVTGQRARRDLNVTITNNVIGS